MIQQFWKYLFVHSQKWEKIIYLYFSGLCINYWTEIKLSSALQANNKPFL